METKAIQKFEQQGLSLIGEANLFKIVDGTTRDRAVEFTLNARKAVKNIEAEFRPDIDAAHKLHKDLLDRLKKLTAPFIEAKGIVDKEISRDFLEQDRIRQAEARKQEEEVAAEKKRQEAELAAEVEEAINDGDMELAESLVDSDVVMTPAMLVPETQRTVKSDAGSTTVRRDIKVELVDKWLVIGAIAIHQLPSDLLDVNMGVVKRYVRAHGGHTALIPGFRITEDVVVSGRTR